MKAILVIDMPTDCPECPMAHWNKLDEFTGCEAISGKKYAINDKEYAESSCRPSWCPLKDLPQKIEGKREMFMPTYSLGWNDCIGTILGEEEGNNGLKPLKDESHEYYGCPSCRHIVSSMQNYCENCGQKLDWRDIGETE